jgi:hypothetical protein
MNLDDVRAKFPHLGVAVYAFEPKGPVTLECIAADGSIYKFEGATEHDAVMAGFGEDLTATPAESPAPTSNIFD